MVLEDFQKTNEGTLVYRSHSTGPFVLHSMSINSKIMKDQVCVPFVDCPITVRKIHNCFVSHVNLIHTPSIVFTNSGYHFETPCLDINKFGVTPDAKIKAEGSMYVYPVISNSIEMEKGFYIGDTDNFGHWLFEFLPKAL